MSSERNEGVSFVIPLKNGAASIGATLDSILAQTSDRPTEVLVVDDGSDDGSLDIVRARAKRDAVRVIAGQRRGAAAALNAGIRAATFPIICQIDQDVVLGPDWMRLVVADLDDSSVAASQGCYMSDRRAPLFARIMGLDLQQRYESIKGPDTTHACTGNSAYRRSALVAVGLFDETLGYGYDNDMSYRLSDAGHRLTICHEASSRHRWRDGLGGYLQQQYGFGYGRLDLVAKHPRHVTGDSVSPLPMMLHPIVMLLALAGFAAAAAAAMLGASWTSLSFFAGALIATLIVERAMAGATAAFRFGDPAAVLFPCVHLLRDLAWVAAIAMWLGRRAFQHEARPQHSMQPRRIPAIPAGLKTGRSTP